MKRPAPSDKELGTPPKFVVAPTWAELLPIRWVLLEVAGFMEPHTRTFRVLVCLGVSMTSGSLLLAWLEPAAQPANTVLTSAQLVAQARSAVRACPEPMDRWRSVILLPQGRGGKAMTLAAVSEADRVHFTIARHGAVHADLAWLTQSRLAEAGEIRIGLSGTEADGTIAQAQLVALRALLGALNEVVVTSPSAIKLPVRLMDRSGRIVSVQPLLGDAALEG